MIDWTSYKPAAGRLLLSEPTLPDPNFARTVVLLTEHNEIGSLGFVLNRPVNIHLHDLGEDFLGSQLPLYEGGPVELNTLHFIHRLGKDIEGTIEIADSIFWGGNIEQIKVNLSKLSENEIRFFIGYSGWGAGQLEMEMKQHTWLVAPAVSTDIFEVAPDQLWEKCIRGLGGKAAELSNYPIDPRMN